MQRHPAVAVMLGLMGLLYAGSPVSAQFVDGQVLTAEQLNTLVNRVAALEARLAAEMVTRQAADTALQSSLMAEVAARQAADTGLQSTLQGNLDAEVAARQAADTGLQSTLQGNLDAEVVARQAADTGLQSTLQGNLDAEVVARQAADTGLQQALACQTTSGDSATGGLVVFENCDVQIRNGLGQTDSLNGRGNLIIGYNEDSGADALRAGSHNLVVGPEHSYSSYGGLVAGFQNTLSAPLASVSGGQGQLADDPVESLSGDAGLAMVISDLVAETAARQAADTGFQGNLDAEVAARQAADTALQGSLDTVTSNPVLGLGPFVQVAANPLNGLNGPHVLLSGVNVHIRSGSGQTDDGGSPNGRGNLIIGYNEDDAFIEPDGPNTRTGSHNLVIGPEHSYSSFGGLLAGFQNTLSGPFSSISGGQLNYVSTVADAVPGGAAFTANTGASGQMLAGGPGVPIVDFNTKRDPFNVFDLSTDRFVAPDTGRYYFSVTVTIGGGNGQPDGVIIGLRINAGTTFDPDNSSFTVINPAAFTNAAGEHTVSVSGVLNLTAGDFVDVAFEGLDNGAFSVTYSSIAGFRVH